MKIHEDKNGRYVFLPRNNKLGESCIWEEVQEGLLLRNLESGDVKKC